MKMERKTGFEPATFSLARRCSTNLSYFRSHGRLSAAVCAAAACASAEGQNRTDDTSVFSAVLYLLSYLGRCMYLNDGVARCQVLGGELGPPGFCLGSACSFVVWLDTAFMLVLVSADAAGWAKDCGHWGDRCPQRRRRRFSDASGFGLWLGAFGSSPRR